MGGKKILFVVSISLVLIAHSCTKHIEEGAELHPVPERIPYFEKEYIPIEKNRPYTIANFENILDNQPEIKTLYYYLNNSDRIISKKIDLFLGNIEGVEITSCNRENLMVLDGYKDELFGYNLTTGEKTIFAKQGRGPGDLMFSKEIIKREENIYVVLQDFRIAKFVCTASELEFKRRISLSARPHSATLIDDSAYAVIATFDMQTNGQTTKYEDEFGSLNPIKIVNSDGEIIEHFGDAYDIQRHWMLIRPFIINSRIRYSSATDNLLLAYRRFPFIYMYSNTSNKIDTILKFSDFILGKQKYWPQKGQLRIVLRDHSIINALKIIDEKYALINVTAKTNMREVPNNRLWNINQSFYLVNLENYDSYFLGEKEFNIQTNIHSSKYGLFVNSIEYKRWVTLK